jgi:hypothetical protein
MHATPPAPDPPPAGRPRPRVALLSRHGMVYLLLLGRPALTDAALARLAATSLRSVQRVLAELEAAGYIRRTTAHGVRVITVIDLSAPAPGRPVAAARAELHRLLAVVAAAARRLLGPTP